MHSVSEFRQWLLGRPQLVLRMMRHVEKAHSPAPLNYPGAPAPAARRRPPGARLWISRAPEETLHVLCYCGLRVGCSQLVELGQGDFLEDPDLDQLVRMLEILPPELAQLVLYGLMFATHLPAHRFTESHGEELRRAVAVKGEPVAADIWERPSCTPAMWSDETEGEAAVGEDADSTARAQAPTVPAPDILSLRTTGLREGAAELANRLEAFAAAIRDGRQPVGYEALLSAVTSWIRERQSLAEAFAEAVPAAAEGAEPSDLWGPDAGWVEAAALTERLREEERERGRIAEEIAKVVQAHDEAVGLLEQAVSDLMRQTLVDQVAQFEQKLRELRGEPGADTTASEAESDSTASTGTDRVPRDEGSGETDPGPAPQDEIPDLEGETTPHGADDGVREQGDTTASQDGGAGGSLSSGNTPKPVAAATTVVLPGPKTEAVDQPEAVAAQGTDAAQVRWEATTPGCGEHHDEEARASGNQREIAAPAAPRPPAPSRTEPDADKADPASADGWAGAKATVEALVAEGRLAEAYWVSRAAGVSEHRTLALAFADAAFHDSPASASDLQVKAEEFLDAVTRSRPLASKFRDGPPTESVDHFRIVG